MKTFWNVIVITMLVLPLWSCATPRGTVELEGGEKAEVTDYNLFGVTLWTKSILKEGSFAATARMLKNVSKYFVVGGLVLMVLCGGLILSVSTPGVQGFMLGGLVVGVCGLFAGIVTSLIANPWVLGGVFCLTIITCIAGGYWLIKTRNWSLFGKAKELKHRISKK